MRTPWSEMVSSQQEVRAQLHTQTQNKDKQMRGNHKHSECKCDISERRFNWSDTANYKRTPTITANPVHAKSAATEPRRRPLAVIAIAVSTHPKLPVLSGANVTRLPSTRSSDEERVLRRDMAAVGTLDVLVEPSRDEASLAETNIEARCGKTTLGARSKGDNLDDCDSCA